MRPLISEEAKKERAERLKEAAKIDKKFFIKIKHNYRYVII